MYRNLVTDLLRYEHLSTTQAKAKEVRGFAEKIITLGKRNDLHARRQALAFVSDKKVVAKVFDELAERYSERPGGYTRIIKLGPRLGDAAPMVRLELVE
jgi:large subunit ribosomal protein L17